MTRPKLYCGPNYITFILAMWPNISPDNNAATNKCGKESSPYRKRRINTIDELWKTSKSRTIRGYQNPSKHPNSPAKMELFAKIVNGIQLLTFFTKISMLDDWQGSEYVSENNIKLTHCRKMKFSIKDFVSKCNQICSFLLIWSHLLKKVLMENFNFCAVTFQCLRKSYNGLSRAFITFFEALENDFKNIRTYFFLYIATGY